jgi:hypothetical protein
LHIAANNGHAAVVRQLLQNGGTVLVFRLNFLARSSIGIHACCWG